MKDLEEVFEALRRMNKRLNSEKCAFDFQGGKFMGFMLTYREIEAKLRSPQNVKEVKQLIG